MMISLPVDPASREALAAGNMIDAIPKEDRRMIKHEDGAAGTRRIKTSKTELPLRQIPFISGHIEEPVRVLHTEEASRRV